MERSLILIKPDGMQRGLIGKVIERFEQAGFKMVAAKLVQLDDELLDKWYSHHKDKDFFPGLVSFMKETPVLAMIWQGEGIIEKAREIGGATDPAKAAPGTIRAEYGTEIQKNIVHLSDSQEAAEKEIDLIFNPEEILQD